MSPEATVDPSPELVVAFVNTRGILATDPHAREELPDADALRAWWRERGLVVERARPLDVRRAHAVREGLRAALARHNDATVDGDDVASEELRAIAESTALHLDADAAAGAPALRPGEDGTARAGIAWLLVAVAQARLDGSWSRLKVCADPDCREAFLDRTRNGSRTWCSMQVCGARAKQRTFTTRHRGR